MLPFGDCFLSVEYRFSLFFQTSGTCIVRSIERCVSLCSEFSLSCLSCLISVCCTQLYRRAGVGSVDFIGRVGEIPAVCDIVKFAPHEQLLYECLMCNDRSDSAVPRSLCAAITYYDYLVLVLVVIL